MANTDPWYMQYPLARLKTDPTVKEDYTKLVEKYKATTKPFELTDEELKKFETTAKRWESDSGYREIQKKTREAKKHYTWARKQGYNLDSPRSEKEAALSKAINDEMTDAKESADLYARNQEAFDTSLKEIRAQQKLPEHERTMDVEKSWDELRAITFGKGSVRDKNLAYFNYSTTAKAKPIDKQKTWTTNFKNIAWGEDERKSITEDERTGKIITTSETGMSDKRVKEANEKTFENLPEHEKKQYKEEYDAAEDKGGKSFKDWTIEKYSPIVAKKTLDSEKFDQRGRGGTGPAVDEKGSVIWTKPTRDMKNPNYGPESTTHRTTASISFANLYPKPTSFVNLPVTKSTTDLSTGKTATDEEGNDFVGESLPSIPMDVEFYAEATEDLRIPKKGTRLFGQGYIVITKGTMISEADKETIDKANAKAKKIVYRYDDIPYLIKRTLFKQLDVTNQYDIKTWGTTNRVPYLEIRDRLINLEGFAPYDKEILKMNDKLNPFRSKGSGDIKF